jgi:hypothetical protein
MGSPDKVDVFISYTGRDRTWAIWLDFILREADYTTIVQEYDFPVGKSFLAAMDEALKQSQLLVCLLSPAYLASRWCAEEWQTGLLKDKLFPLLIARCELDGLLAPRSYLDLVGLSEGDAKTRILTELKKKAGEDPRPKQKPAFPGIATTAERPPFPAEPQMEAPLSKSTDAMFVQGNGNQIATNGGINVGGNISGSVIVAGNSNNVTMVKKP